MSKKNPTKFEKKGMELWRNGEHIATRTEDDVLMQPDCDKFAMIAVKMLNSKAFNDEHGLKPINVEKPSKKEEKSETETVNETPTIVEENITFEVPEDDSDFSELDFLREQNKKLQEQINAINQKEKMSVRFPDDFKPEPIYSETPVQPQEDNFLSWAGVTGEGKPPLPPPTEFGTKDPARREWLEANYPEVAKEKYASFYQKRKFLLARDAKRAQEKAMAEEERKRIFG